MRKTGSKIGIEALAAAAIALLCALPTLSGCSTMRGLFATDPSRDEASKPIRNPFGDFQAQSADNPSDTMIFRSKRGDGAVEVQIPRATQGVTDFVLPMPAAQAYAGSGGGSRGPASIDDFQQAQEPAVDNTYQDRTPSMSDREIVRTFPQSSAAGTEEAARQREIEQNLGLMPAEDPTPERQHSYLASIDHVKQLYRIGRYEAGLLEVDSLIRDYPTDPRLHEMRGTLLDRLGRDELAMKSWNQALRFDPKNESLRKFIQKREQSRPSFARQRFIRRGVASQ